MSGHVGVRAEGGGAAPAWSTPGRGCPIRGRQTLQGPAASQCCFMCLWTRPGQTNGQGAARLCSLGVSPERTKRREQHVGTEAACSGGLQAAAAAWQSAPEGEKEGRCAARRPAMHLGLQRAPAYVVRVANGVCGARQATSLVVFPAGTYLRQAAARRTLARLGAQLASPASSRAAGQLLAACCWAPSRGGGGRAPTTARRRRRGTRGRQRCVAGGLGLSVRVFLCARVGVRAWRTGASRRHAHTRYKGGSIYNTRQKPQYIG